MRLRNVKNAREIVDNSSFVVHEPKEYKENIGLKDLIAQFDNLFDVKINLLENDIVAMAYLYHIINLALFVIFYRHIITF